MKKALAGLVLTIVFLTAFLATPAESQDTAPFAYTLKINGIIGPATDDLIKRHLKIAEERHAEVMILEMHTPGGLYDSMQQIIQGILDSPVPVVTYVSPAGSHAASAGTYILYASHIAAMAPGTNIGAATPIQMGNNQPEQKDDPSIPDTEKESKKIKPATTLERKMVNDASAYIKTLAELRGRNVEWAEKAVREAETLTASEALSKKAIDVIADDIPDLLKKIDGKTVKMSHGQSKTLHTKGAKTEMFEADWRTQILEVITHPNVAFLLMTGGGYGIIYEFAHPGAFFPGVMGAICIILALFAMNVLPINYTGVSLIVLGICLMTGEAFAPSFGVLGIGGLISFAAGGMMLIDSTTPGFGVDLWVIAAMSVISFGVLSLILAFAVRAQRKPPTTGAEELLSSLGEVLEWAQGHGQVQITGETWRAEAATDYILKKGDKVRVTEIRDLTLIVIPEHKKSTS